MRLRTLFTSVLLIALTTSQVKAQTSLLTVWKAGDECSYTIEDKHTISFGTGMLNQRLTLDTRWQVKTVEVDGSALIEVTIERVRFEADQKELPATWENLSFDSAKPVEGRDKAAVSTFAALNAFVGKQALITINKKREISAFELSKPLATHLDENRITLELAGFFGPTFTRNGMRRRLTGWLIPSPPSAVSVGGTWEREQVTRYENVYVCKDTYKLEGPIDLDGEKPVKIEVKTEFDIPADVKGKPQRKIAKQSGEGIVYFEEATGLIIEATLNQEVAEQALFAASSFKTTIIAKIANTKP